MLRIILLAYLCVMTSIHAINRPVYKIVLTQKGYAQFLQYDVETPPLREFTFCTWIRVYELTNDQTIFTYIVNGYNRIMRLWLDSGGKKLRLSIREKVTSNFTVSIEKDVWRHVCLSYQSDYGSWALYLDSRLVSCETAQSLNGFVLPGGGSVIIGYGSDNNGISNGFEGEIFGANMILTSTIEKNYTIKKDPHFEQKLFSKNKIRNTGGKNMQYIILSNLQTERSKNNYEIPLDNGTEDYNMFQTTNNFIDQVVDIDSETTTNREEDLIDFGMINLNYPNTKSVQFDLWKTLNSTFYPSAQTTQSILQENPRSDPHSLSLYETPPPKTTNSYYDAFDIEQRSPKLESIYKIKDSTSFTKKTTPRPSSEISDIETPPPIQETSKVYGQWTSSKFAGNVLNYLKSINFQKRDHSHKRVPPTISLNKYSDTYPYASDFSITKLRPPHQFVRNDFLQKRFDTFKTNKQINVQILEDDLRSNIIRMHSLTQPKNVEISTRGGVGEEKKSRVRYYRSAKYDDKEKSVTADNIYNHHTFSPSSLKMKFRDNPISNVPNQKYKSVLPFLKTLENSGDYHTTDEPQTNNDNMYTKTLSQGNKWHNVKSYSNDYTPRKINVNSFETNDHDVLNRHPAIRLKYKHEKHKIVQGEHPAMIKGKNLAKEVSDQSNYNTNSVSLMKYNHGFLESRQKKHADKKHPAKNTARYKQNNKNNFDKPVKLGNTLNERFIIGDNGEQTKKSFVDSNLKTSDINKYKIKLENQYGFIGSTAPRACKNIELYDRVLYVQQDESIDMTHILSPVRAKNIGIEFIMQNYKKCSLTDSKLEINPKLYIDWSKTPVRLFGGARPKTTTDLCGFF